MPLTKCKECGEKISTKAEACPHCGAKQKKPTSIVTWLILIIIGAAVINSALSPDYQEKATETKKAQLQKDRAYFNKNRASIISTIEKYIESGNYKNALIQIDKYIHTNDKDLIKYYADAKEPTLLAELKKLPASKTSENLHKYNQLLTLRPTNKKYKQKVAYYQTKIDAVRKESEARIAKFGAKPVKSTWDGSYREVEKYLQLNAHDPGSIDIQNCTNVYHNSAGWLVRCTYRGKNAFGALVQSTKWFNIRNGRVIEDKPASAYSI